VLVKSLMNSRRLMGFTPVAENHLRKPNTIFDRELCTTSQQKELLMSRWVNNGLSTKSLKCPLFIP
jgi:hypothetical protein